MSNDYTCPTCGREYDVPEDTFAARLQKGRIERGLTRAELGSALGYQRSSVITRWETSNLQPSDIAVVESLAAALDTTPAWLLYGVQEDPLPDMTTFGDGANVDVETFGDGYVAGESEGEEVPVDPDDRPGILKKLKGEG